jgi:mRNA interferase RelE/StbE
VTSSAWAVSFDRRADKDFARLDAAMRRRVAVSIERLADDPDNAPGVRRLAGRSEQRLRVGEWRVLFELDRTGKRIVVLRILPRGRAYDR